MDDEHRKNHPSLRAARHERSLLRLVQGPGVVPVVDTDGPAVTTHRGIGSLADTVAERAPLPEAQARGAAASVARAVSRLHDVGIVHGDIKPANVVFAPDGDLWLVDFDASGPTGESRGRVTPGRLHPRHLSTPLRPQDDVVAIAILAVECATGVVIDPSSCWDTTALERIGCPAELAADTVPLLRRPPDAARVAEILHRRDDQLPPPPRRAGDTDPTPTVDIPPVAIAGLSPCGDAAAPR